MSAETATDPKFEIGHVLFIDVVGYSKFNIDEQTSLLRDLNRIVQNTPEFRRAEADGKLISLPTGDGVALVFRDRAESPAQCAIETGIALRNHSRIPVRMGIHSGPVNEVTDVNNRVNLAGAGINIAQRVMDCGDAGHILLSKHVAEDLEHYARWQPLLHDLGECEVKHGLRLGIVNLHDDAVGNRQLPEKIRKARAESTIAAQVRKRRLAVALLLILIAVGTFSLIYRNRTLRPFATIPVKSIAVLPFENLSANPENAFFADGVQDEILTDLARIADLKVISRASVMQYKSGVQRNARAIALALGVVHLLEGSVQRAGGKVRVNAQLIDARDDTHLWAQTYDRDLADVFAIQSEIAKTIAGQLQAKLSPSEKAAIERAPTTDVTAFDLYTQAKNLVLTLSLSANTTPSLLQAADLLNQAVARDSAFLFAYCQLAAVHDYLYFFGHDHTPSRLALADAALQTALRLRPDSGEAHLALARHFYYGYLNYDYARAEIAIAQRTISNEPVIFELTGYIDRRQGRWEEAERNLERALDLDPRNLFLLQQISFVYGKLRRYPEIIAVLNRALSIVPKDIDTRVTRAFVDLDWHADIRPLRATIESILAENPGAAAQVADSWLTLALCERDAISAGRALPALGENSFAPDAILLDRTFGEGLVARMMKDDAKARDAFIAARAKQQKIVQDQPDYGPAFCVLGLIDAALGRKEDALQEGRRAMELLPVAKDSINGGLIIEFFAITCAWAGEKDLAIEQLTVVAPLSGHVTYGQLKLNPFWDPLRGDPRFEKIVASLAPKD